MKSFCVLCGRSMVIPAEKPVPIICSVCEGRDLEDFVAEGSFVYLPEEEKKEEEECPTKNI